jgi:hypothetical protein
MTRAAHVLSLAALVLACQTARTGPVPIVWDAEACAECRMHVGEPRFAAQLQTTDGQILNFDDPGCALRFVARERPSIAELYFHHHEEDTWLTRSQTAFARASTSPMGYGLGATTADTPGALSVAQATEQVLRSASAAAH